MHSLALLLSSFLASQAQDCGAKLRLADVVEDGYSFTQPVDRFLILAVPGNVSEVALSFGGAAEPLTLKPCTLKYVSGFKAPGNLNGYQLTPAEVGEVNQALKRNHSVTLRISWRGKERSPVYLTKSE